MTVLPHALRTHAICTEKAASEEMRSLREKLPSGSALTALKNHDSFGDELGMPIHFKGVFLPVFFESWYSLL
jgi:hypothetical protein